MRIACFDGDDVGAHLELLLLTGHLDQAQAFSEGVSAAIFQLTTFLRDEASAVVYIAGGDNVVASWASEPECALFDQARDIFREACGRTLSVGVGQTPSEALHALRLAKLKGKDRVYIAPGASP